VELPDIAKYLDGTLMERLQIAVDEATAERVVAHMPVEGNMQPFGVLHGGATAALCETVASIGGALSCGPDRHALGIEINVNHIHAVREGVVTAAAVPLHSGRTTAVWDIRVTDDQGRLTAVSRVTLALRDVQK
jgi:1,4-dihydroxy-2-naphthoyl-CoA hydrolase